MKLQATQKFAAFFIAVWLVAISSFSAMSYAKPLLKVELNKGLSSEVRNNVLGHLGTLPETASARSSFIYEAQKHANIALQALGYYRAEISQSLARPAKGVWTLTLNITVNEPTRVNEIQVEVSGDGEQDPDFIQIINQLPLKPYDILHHGKYEKIKNDLTALGLDKGYFQGQISTSVIAVHESFETADIKIIYDSGKRYRFGQVNFSEFNIERELLEKVVPFNYGDYFTTAQLFKLQSQLQQTQFFGSAIVTPNKKSVRKEHLPIDVKLTKAKSHYFDLGIGFSTDTDFRYSAGWRTPLINKYGHRQETKIEYSKINPKGRFVYTIPLTHPINNLLQIQLKLSEDEYGDITSNYTDYKLANLRKFDRWTGQFFIRHLDERWQLTERAFHETLVLPGFSFGKTRSYGSQIDPTAGFSQFYTVEGANDGLGSNIDLIRLYGRWRFITTLKPKHRIVVRAELGAAIIDDENKEKLPPSLRFFAGGDQSIRGFAYQSLGTMRASTFNDTETEPVVVGGTHLAVGSIEYQYYFTDTMRGVVFSDGGNAADKLAFTPVYSVGSGFHYISPIGPIRLDVGYAISEDDPSWRVHLTLGTEL